MNEKQNNKLSDKQILAVASRLYLSAQCEDDIYAMLIALSSITYVKNNQQVN